ncbi:MAG: PAS domain S-box protein, partial [Thermodesulfobacteriota bacterium]
NIGRIISSSLDIDKVYKVFAEEAHKIISFNLIAITLIDHEKRTFCPAYLAGAYVPGRTREDIVTLKESFTEKVMLQKSGIILQTEKGQDLLSYAPKLSPFWQRGFRSFMGIPLISHDVVIGVLHIYSQKSNAYKDADLKLAERIGSQIAGAIANAQLYEERQQALAQLKISEERYRNLVEYSPDMILLHDYEKYIYANPAAVKILGASRAEDIIGKPIREIIHPDFWPIVKDRLAQLHSGDSVPLLEEKYNTLEGKVIEVEVVASPVLYQGQRLVQVVARDITERKEAEREMAQLQEQLRESQKLETVGRLAGGIAHDFNNLLTVIQGNAQLALLSLPENDPLRTNMEDILRAAQRAADLTRQMLAFGRRQILSLKMVDLNYIIREMQEMIENLVGEDIEVVISLADKLGKVRVDPEQMKQVIMNLVVNAKEAMPQGGKLILQTDAMDLKEVFLRTYPEMTPGKYVRITVADTGKGIPLEIKEKIFEPFFTTKDVGKGSGLGLSSVYGIIKQSGGNILVESELGKGTLFKIFLPQIEDLSAEAERSKEEGALPLKKTVLVVEDNPEIRELIGQILRKEGYLVLEAKNGQEALSLGHKFKNKIDLLLMELVTAEIAGDDLAKALLYLHPEMKLLYLSDFEGRSRSNKEELIKEQPNRRTPFSIQPFIEKVRNLLK